MLFTIRHHFDGKLFNIRRLQAKSRVHREMLDMLFYEDDMSENAKTERKLQGHMDCFTSL